MNRNHAIHSKEAIDFLVPKIKEFWLSDDAIDFITKVGYLYNGYYVPTKIDNELNYNKKYNEHKRPSQKELIREELLNVIIGACTPEKALESIKRKLIDHEYYVARPEDTQ